MQLSTILGAVLFASSGLAVNIYNCGVTNMLAGNIKYDNCSPAAKAECKTGCQATCGFDLRLWDASYR